jgi:hypothetical protein
MILLAVFLGNDRIGVSVVQRLENVVHAVGLGSNQKN